MSINLHPALFLILGGLILPLFRGKVRQALLIIFPLLGFINLLGYESGDFWSLYFGGYDLEVLRVDKLSLIFGYLFHLAAFLAAIYSLHLKDGLQHMTGLMYAGSAVGAVFAGDLLTLFIFWELLAITSVFQIWARRTSRSRASGLRYLLIHVTSGLILLTGAALQYQNTGSLSFKHMELASVSSYLIFIAFGIKCAFPLLHTWVVDSYPEATPTGTVFLCSFTTKTAVYALARGFEGTEQLIWIGAIMSMFPIFYAVIENDMRRVLSYSMINQIGFMVVGIGLGAGMGVNGAVAHAFSHIIYKGLLFMSMGAVLFRTGRINCSDLGGLYKSMPFTTGFCIVGASSISAFPLFSGFISKSMVMQAAADQGHLFIWLALLFASAGVFHHAGIKVPYFAFFSQDSGIRCKEAPLNMLIAMWGGAFLCIFIGCYPWPLYSMLPYPVDYLPYTATHVLLQLQVLFFSALAFAYLKLSGAYPPELKSVSIDIDWTYRRLLPRFISAVVRVGAPLRDKISHACRSLIERGIGLIQRHHGPEGIFERTWLTGSIVMMVTIALAAYLIYYF
jgi:multicomponent Na+:H+ antiporter subunit D